MGIFMSLFFCVIGFFFIGAGVPFVRNRISPNQWYGFRTQTTLSNLETWYRVNHILGIWLIIGGAVVLATAITLYFLRLTPQTAVFINLGTLMLFIFAATLHGLVIQSKPNTSKVPTNVGN